MKQIPPSESFTELTFPVQGVNVATEYELQPPQTTPRGVNVRGYEPLTNRQRGGSRPGLSEYVPQQVSGTNLIQHLNYVVDPAGQALLTASDGFGGSSGIGIGGVLDPSTNNNADGLGTRNPGRAVRPGGSGVQPNRQWFTPFITPHPGGGGGGGGIGGYTTSLLLGAVPGKSNLYNVVYGVSTTLQPNHPGQYTGGRQVQASFAAGVSFANGHADRRPGGGGLFFLVQQNGDGTYTLVSWNVIAPTTPYQYLGF